MANIEVFKTNVHEITQAKAVVAYLHLYFPESYINFDLDDCDRILRIEGVDLISSNVESLVRQIGFTCKVLK